MNIRAPRLYIDDDIQAAQAIALNKDQSHYLTRVMRMEEGADIRIFNGANGEWLARLQGKNALIPHQQTREQKDPTRRVGLVFSPIKKDRMDFLIEKAVELGATDLYPVICDHSAVRNIKEPRINAQIIEAAEQCERLDIPTLHPLQKLNRLKNAESVYVAMERMNNITSGQLPESGDVMIAIGPEGGWSETERDFFVQKKFIQFSLGERILRAETAALSALAQIS